MLFVKHIFKKILIIFFYGFQYFPLGKKNFKYSELETLYKPNINFFGKEEIINFNHSNYKVHGNINLFFLKFKKKFYLNKSFFLSLSNIWAIGHNDNPTYLDSNYKFILETLNNDTNYINYSGIFNINYLKIRFYPKHNFIIKKKVISFTGTLSDNKFHWLIDYMPRLKYFYENNLLNDYIFIINKKNVSFQREYLIKIGIKPENIINWTNENYKIEELIVPSLPFFYYGKSYLTKYEIYSYESLNWFRKIMLEKYAPKLNKDNKRIMITRGSSKKRYIKNISQIKILLKKYNFVFLDLDNYSENEIISLFYNAEIIMAIHGAGLSNIIYSKNSKIIEIFPKNMEDQGLNVLYQLSMFFNLEHHILVSDNLYKNGSFNVDPKKLENIIKFL